MGRHAKLEALVLFGTVAVVIALPWAVAAQTVGDTFRKVSPAVVVIRATGRDVSGRGEVRFTEVGSGVLTTAHVVASDMIEQTASAARRATRAAVSPRRVFTGDKTSAEVDGLTRAAPQRAVSAVAGGRIQRTGCSGAQVTRVQRGGREAQIAKSRPNRQSAITTKLLLGAPGGPYGDINRTAYGND